MPPRSHRRVPDRGLSTAQYLRAAKEIATLTWTTVPGTIVLQIAGAIITAILPIVTTFFAAATTTALAEAYAGDDTAGQRALVYVLITAGLGLLLTGWRSLEQYVQRLMRYTLEAKISDIMYERFLSLEFWRYDDKDTIDTYDRAQRFSQFYSMAFAALTRMLSQLITLLASVIALLLVGWWLAVILMVAIIPGVYLQFKLSRAQVKHWNETIDVRRSKGIIERQLFQPEHIAELRLYGMVRHLLNLRQQLRDADERERLIFERRYILRRLAADALEVAAEVGSLLWVTFQIIAREQPIGQFLYVQQIVSRALGAMNSFVTELSSMDEQLANLFDYQEFMELDTRKGGDLELSGPPAMIEVKDVSFRYPSSDEDVLEQISLSIARGERVAIVGENGAGKSTLIKLLSGLYAPSSGVITLDGTDLREFSLDSWHKQLAVLQQDFLSYSFASARDNVYFGKVSKPFDQKRFDAALTKAESREFIEKLPKGADSYVSPWMAHPDGVNGVDLSGGQWQRMALARNFYRDAPIIILDEPTSAIDALAESRIFNHLFADTRQTLIIISHRLTTVERADRIYMLKNGRIVEQGTHDQLVALRGEFFTMFESQI